MRKSIIVCDGCKIDKKVFSFSIFVDRITDPAGDREDVYEDFDLCDSCMADLIKAMSKSNAPASDYILQHAQDMKKR